MADFTSVAGISTNINAAGDILRIFKNIYGACIEVEAILARYGTDPDFQLEANHLFNVDQLAELSVMIGNIHTLRSVWQTDHAGPLGL